MKIETPSNEKFGDKLVNRFSERAQIWGGSFDNDAITNGKAVLRARNAFLAARKALRDYVLGLELTIEEMDGAEKYYEAEIKSLHERISALESSLDQVP